MEIRFKCPSLFPYKRFISLMFTNHSLLKCTYSFSPYVHFKFSNLVVNIYMHTYTPTYRQANFHQHVNLIYTHVHTIFPICTSLNKLAIYHIFYILTLLQDQVQNIVITFKMWQYLIHLYHYTRLHTHVVSFHTFTNLTTPCRITISQTFPLFFHDLWNFYSCHIVSLINQFVTFQL